MRGLLPASLSNPKPTTAPLDACHGLIRAVPERGICRVICFSPRHDLTLAEMEADAIRRVIDLWVEHYVELSRIDFISHVLIFENKGELMGCSNPHPHGQIWANEHVPHLAARKIESQLKYHESHDAPLLLDYLEWELAEGERIVCQNEHFVALVPFWAVWPFETMILPRRPVSSIADLTDSERSAWAAILKDLTVRYDNVFETSFPYSMGITQKPTNCGRGVPAASPSPPTEPSSKGRSPDLPHVGEYPGLIMHQSFYPPLLRSATIRKFLVGYEMSGEPQRDITQEQAAARLRECGGEHYSKR